MGWQPEVSYVGWKPEEVLGVVKLYIQRSSRADKVILCHTVRRSVSHPELQSHGQLHWVPPIVEWGAAHNRTRPSISRQGSKDVRLWISNHNVGLRKGRYSNLLDVCLLPISMSLPHSYTILDLVVEIKRDIFLWRNVLLRLPYGYTICKQMIGV